MKKTAIIALCLTLCLALAAPATPAAEPLETKEALGKPLFFDTNLSKNRTQACATCYNPDRAFTDPRETEAGLAVSLGDDGTSLGDRNTPTAGYASFSPAFHKSEKDGWVGGQFLDGREKDLEGQAGGPPLNPIEMGMPDKPSVVGRIKENPAYVAAFRKLFGESVFDKAEDAYAALT
ncbi:MAG: cytochrome-c peroxidase [Rhodospirillaceae bacterium]